MMINLFIFLLGIFYVISPLQSLEKNTNATAVSTAPEQEIIDQILNFARGHQEFRDLYFKQNEEEFIRLVREGQSPQTLFIGCSDSRIVPDLLLGTRPGDLFVIRTAGNFVPPYDFNHIDGTAATLQYAVEVLNVKHIVVCGHSHCGAIQGLFEKIDPNKLGLLKEWIKFGEPAKRMALLTIKQSIPKEKLFEVTEQLSVIFQLENLMTYPFIKQRVKDQIIDLHGWYYTIETGEVEYYDPDTYHFKLLRVLAK